MKKAILAQKVLASVLAIGLGGFVLPLVAQANSGLSEGTIKIDINIFYVGSKGAADNVVIIDSDLPEKNVGVIGGYTENGDVVNNSVSISGGEVGAVYGGYGDYAEQNKVNMSGGKVTGNVFGGYAQKGNAEQNKVNISGGTVTEYVCGGDALNGSAEQNKVNISGGEVGAVHGGDGEYAEKNIVNISGGTVTEKVYGGYAVNENAEQNKVNISGGKVTGEVYGGRSYHSSATGNSIILSGTADVRQANLYGGYSSSHNATVENNKLIINGWSGTVKSLNNFNGAEGGIEVQALGGRKYKVGDEITVITASGGIGNISMDITQDAAIGVALTATGTVDIKDGQGVSLVHDDGKIENRYGEVKVEYTVNNIRASDQTAITTESRAAAAAFVNQGAEAVSDSINSLQGAEAGISTFATVSGNNSKYDTGSYVDINGWNGIVGVAKTKDLNAGKFSYGAFFENGGGNYNTYNDFNGTSFRGDGNVVYNGGGLLMRYEQEDGVYTEASLRAGTAKNEVSNALEFADNRYGFKTENAYYGAHIGIGKIIKLDNGKAWDIYGKYFHTHHEGDSVKIANDVFDFDSVDSDKLRIGARFSEQQGEKLTSYYGLAWEYEFSGDAGGTANHYAMYTPSLEGSTVIGEVGFRYTPGKASPWYFDANVRGYAGMQEGISGSVQAVYSF